MSDDTVCGLCEQSVSRNRTIRAFGLDICNGCETGKREVRARHRGIELGEPRQWTESKNQGSSGASVAHCAECRATVTAPALDVRAAFTREHLGAKLAKLFRFRDEIQVGDAIFDDVVLITTETEQATRQWLDDEGVQSAILDMVADGLSVKIEGETIHARGCSSSELSGFTVQLAVFALAVYLTRG